MMGENVKSGTRGEGDRGGDVVVVTWRRRT